MMYNDILKGFDYCCSVTKLCPTLSPHGLQLSRLPCSSPTLSLLKLISVELVMPSNSPSVSPFSCPQSFPASESFPVSRLFASCGQSIVASASVFPVTIQGWFPLELTGLISLRSKGLSRVFSNTTVQRHHQFFGAQPSLWSNSHTIEKP